MPKKPTKPKKPYPPQALRSQLIVTTKPGFGDLSALVKAVEAEGGTVSPLFGSRQQLQEDAARVRTRGVRIPDLSGFHVVDAPEESYRRIIARVRRLGLVSDAYIKPPADAPFEMTTCADTTCTPPTWVPPVTPDFSLKQKYLDKAPGGINARYAWTKPGGTGKYVEIMDIEREWRFTHEDLLGARGLAGGFPIDCLRERNHGTAVLGILRGDDNARGVKGIAPGAGVRGFSTRSATLDPSQIPGTIETALAIHRAAGVLTENLTVLDSGHIILLELHRDGPDGKKIAVEWWPDDFQAIRYAVALGLVVVEAAGNGGADLDAPLYDNGDPASNPFRRGAADSGAIIVGAGIPPVGGHGVDRSRLAESNYGSCVDVQGWGLEVVTTGYGCYQGGPSEDRWYTLTFGYTSGASAMVAGAVACVQGHHRATGRLPLSSKDARILLRTTGSLQQDDVGFPASQHIGPRPNLKRLIAGRRARKRRKRGRQATPRAHRTSRRPQPDPGPRRRRRGQRRTRRP